LALIVIGTSTARCSLFCAVTMMSPLLSSTAARDAGVSCASAVPDTVVSNAANATPERRDAMIWIPPMVLVCGDRPLRPICCSAT